MEAGFCVSLQTLFSVESKLVVIFFRHDVNKDGASSSMRAIVLECAVSNPFFLYESSEQPSGST